MTGQCLCGGVGFEIDGPTTAIELCHCVRCRSAYGAPFAATFYVNARDFRWQRGIELVAVFDLPVRDRPPPYRHSFCRTCGSPLPIVHDGMPFVEIPAGLVGDACDARPVDQIFVQQKAAWWRIDPELPSYDVQPPSEVRIRTLEALRAKR